MMEGRASEDSCGENKFVMVLRWDNERKWHDCDVKFVYEMR
jgi:hypothetical protein